MNKKEQAAFDEALTDMYAARALRWQDDKPEPMTVDEIKAEIDAGNYSEVRNDYSTSTRKAFIGWTYYVQRDNSCVERMGTDGSSFVFCRNDGTPDGSWTRTGHAIYRTQADALRALRYDLTVKYARSLAKIDAQIKAVTE